MLKVAVAFQSLFIFVVPVHNNLPRFYLLALANTKAESFGICMWQILFNISELWKTVIFRMNISIRLLQNGERIFAIKRYFRGRVSIGGVKNL